jgi:outer membrane protein assembly factor BamB
MVRRRRAEPAGERPENRMRRRQDDSMRSRAIPALVMLGLLVLAGCGSAPRTSLAPPLIFPTQVQATPSPAPLSVYLISSNRSNSVVTALNAQEGGQRWQYKIGSDINYPVLDNQTLYVGAADQKLYALNAGNGSLKWSAKTSGPPAVIGTANGLVYAGSYGFFVGTRTTPQPLYALNATDGSLKWKSSVAGLVVFNPSLRDTLYLGMPDGHFYAINASTGALRWQTQLDAQPNYVQEINGQVYVFAINFNGTGSGAFYAFNGSDGSLTWRYPSQAGATQRGLGLLGQDNGLFYFDEITNLQSYVPDAVFALKAADGSQAWRYALTQGSVFSGAAQDGIVYITVSDNNLYALNDQTGAVRWHAPDGGMDASVYTIDSSLIYIFNSGDGLQALSIIDGSARWKLQTAANPRIFDDRDGLLYLDINSQSDNTFSVLDTSTGTSVWHYDAGPAFLNGTVG